MDSEPNITVEQITKNAGKSFSHVDHVEGTGNKPEEKERVSIDGDKTIAFISAIELLAKILNQVNIIEVKDAFLLGRKCASVEKVLEIKKEWLEAFRLIHEGLKSNMDDITKGQQQHRDMLAIIKSFANTVQTREFDNGLKKAKELADLCDRLEKHHLSGLLDIVTKI